MNHYYDSSLGKIHGYDLVASYACFIHDLYIMADNIQSLAGYGSSDGVCSRELNDLIRFSFSITVLRIDNGWSSNA